MRRSLSTTTALIASLALAIPAPTFAQEAAATCTDGSAVPCLPGMEPLGKNGKPVPGTTMTRKEIRAKKAADAAAKSASEAEAAKATGDSEAADEAAAAEAQGDTAAAAAADAGQPADQKAGKKPKAKGQKDAAAAEPAPEPAPEPATEPAPAATTEAAPTPEPKPAETQATADQPVTDANPDAGTGTGTGAGTEAGTADSATAKATTDTTAAQTGTTQTGTADTGTATGQTTAQPAGQTTAQTGAGTQTTPKKRKKQLAVGEAPDLPVQPKADTGKAPVAAAASAVTDDAAEAAGAVVTEETVTEDSVRSSAEDFANKVNETVPAEIAAASTAAAAAGTASLTAQQKKSGQNGGQNGGQNTTQKGNNQQANKNKGDKDEGLSDFEKAMLIGLGAVAVGAILSDNRRVAANSGDRVVVERDDGSYEVIKDDDTLIRQPGSTVRTETFDDGSTRTTVTRQDGSRIVTIRDAEYRVLRRVHIAPNGTQTLLINDTVDYAPVQVSTLPPPRPVRDVSLDDEMALRLALADQARVNRTFSLAQVRDIAQVRYLAPAVDLEAVTFDTGSAAITPDQARSLSKLGGVIEDMIAEDPNEVFLVEGHTDAVGNAAYNLALSDRRAESVALALTEYFDIPPENLVVQGYGEEFLKVDTQAAERQNRRATVRRITDLLQQASAD